METKLTEVSSLLDREARETLLELSTAITKPHRDWLRSGGNPGAPEVGSA